MNKYTFSIDFETTIQASDYEQAMEYLNKKYFNGESETCSFVNIPVDDVRVNPNSRTLQLMDELGEES